VQYHRCDVIKSNHTYPGGNTMRIKLACICLITVSTSVASAENIITFYRDGALLQHEAGAVKGVVDIPIAPGLVENTLRVVPAPGTTILGVEIVKTGHGGTADKDIELLTEQRLRLEDRLQALATRETIFTSAAKSQSGKAPRKTKGNPDPMQAIRQGTDFAIAQLEAVYTARRKTNQEIQKIDTRIAAVRKGSRSADSSIKISVTPPRGRVTLRYATTEQGWQPQYNLNLAGDGAAHLQLSARITGNGRGHQIRVSSGALAESATAETFKVQSGGTALAGYRLPITDERYSESIFNHFSGRITNSSPQYLQPGETGLFQSGTYLGSFRFEGLSSGRSKVISLGK
jgi:hypothetical protein